MSHLANLIDGTLEVRGGAADARSFAARSLGVRRDDVVTDERPLSPLEAVLVGLRLADVIAEHEVTGIIGEDGNTGPVWSSMSTDKGGARYPVEIHASFAPGALAPDPVVIGLRREWQAQSLVGFSMPGRGSEVRRILDRIFVEAAEVANPFRMRTVIADVEQNRLRFRVTDDFAGERGDVVLPERVWRELDRHVVRVFRTQDRLIAAGLSTNRGVLLHGPPGVGKSAAVRVLAASLAREVSIILCESNVVTYQIGALFAELDRLSPALVLIDDFDRIAPEQGEPMRDLLIAMDGVASKHDGVVTLATANSITQFDPAIRRAARFDVEIEVPLPDRAARAAILLRYLKDVDSEVDTTSIAGVTVGATGADLRDLVTEAVLAADATVVSTSLLRGLARKRFAATTHGMYL